MKNLDESLAGEGGAVGFLGMVGAEEGVGGLADNAIAGFGRQLIELHLHFSGGGLEGNKDVCDDGVGACFAHQRGGLTFCFPTHVEIPKVGRKFGEAA